MKKADKIGVYGGTFNPVHYGHLRAAQEVLEMFELDRMIFMPAGVTPFEKPETISSEHRYRMVQAAIKGNPQFMLSDIELKAEGKSYTVDTIFKLRELYPGCELFFILGIDAFLDLTAWKDPDRLVSLTNIVVISRPGYRFKNLASSPYLSSMPHRVLEDLDRGERLNASFEISADSKGYMCNLTGLHISASYIRKTIMSGGKINYLLPESVKSYIIANKLYV